MKKTKLIKHLIIVLLFIFLMLLSASAYVYWGTSNNYEKNIALEGPHGSVIIQMDNYGVPHISSTKDDLDVFFALGYIHAKDRFWQMEFQRHVVAGTLSEIFGNATVPQDKFLRTWGFYRAAKADWEVFEEKTKAIVTSYTAGVNEYLKSNKLPLPLILLRYEPKPWTHIDSIAWGKMIAWQLQNSWQDKIENYYLQKSHGASKLPILKPPYPQHAPTTLKVHDLIQSGLVQRSIQPSELSSANDSNPQLFNIAESLKLVQQFLNIRNTPGKGSNNWVVSGRFTKTGKPILANDIHLELSAPALWYLAELKGPNLHVVGASIPGIPSIIVGRNDFIAWGITSAGLDAQDIYLVPKSEKIETIKEIIKVKGEEPVEHEVKITSVGPIINEVIGADSFQERIAVKWTALLPGDTTAQSFFKINYAQNWEQFKTALRDYVAPSLNFVYADIENNIGYYLPGLIPIRQGWTGQLPIPLDQHHEWGKFIPFEELPHVYNPPDGIILSANNKPVPDTYTHKLTYHWIEMPYRAIRLSELIKNHGDKFDVNAMIKIQSDTKNYLWDDLKPILLQTIPLDALSLKGLEVLKNWDGDLAVNSCGATVFSVWFQEIKKMQPKPTLELLNLSNPIFIINQLISEGEFCKANHANNCKDYLSLSLQQAMKDLVTRLGEDEHQWQWGKIHMSTFKELGLGEVKWLSWIWNRRAVTPGGAYTINVGAYDNNFDQFAGATYRQIIDLSSFENSHYVQALGQSDNPLNSHYDDQLDLWKRNLYIKMKH